MCEACVLVIAGGDCEHRASVVAARGGYARGALVVWSRGEQTLLGDSTAIQASPSALIYLSTEEAGARPLQILR